MSGNAARLRVRSIDIHYINTDGGFSRYIYVMSGNAIYLIVRSVDIYVMSGKMLLAWWGWSIQTLRQVVLMMR